MNFLLRFPIALRYCLLFCVLSTYFHISLCAQPVLVSYSPSAHGITTASTNVSLSWSAAMSTASLTAANIRVRGSMTSSYSTNAVFSYSNGNTVVTINPQTNFKPGELITVSATTGVRSAASVPVTRATMWSFRAASGPGSGQYGASTNFALSQSPWAVAMGDMNRDGNLDIVTGNPGAFSVFVRLGNGAGGLGSEQEFDTALGTFSIALGDVNGDGRLDVCAANIDGDNVSVMLGNGSGGFSSVTNVAVGSGPGDIVVADFNGDGKLDFATANGRSNNISIRLGNGNGTFTSASNVGGGPAPGSLATGDVNNDGRLDLISYVNGNYSVHVRLGNGNGTFGSANVLSQELGGMGALVGDMNNDGNLDLLVPNYFQQVVWLQLGDGTGNFAPGDSIPVGFSPQNIALNDINGDGFLDIATANYDSNSVSILLNDKSGGYGYTHVADIPVGTHPSSVALGDMNNDGRLDFATANIGGDNISIALGKPPAPVLVGFSPSAGAHNVATSANITAVFSTSANVASATTNIKIYGSMTGKLSTSAVVYNTTSNTLTLNPALNFKPGERITVVATTGVRSAADVSLTRATTWSFTAASGKASGVFTLPSNVTLDNHPFNTAFGDFNGDGNLDIAVSNAQANTVAVRFGNGSGGFSGNTEVAVGNGPGEVVVGDVNNDGKLDFAVANTQAGTVSVRLGDGSGGFTSTADIPSGMATYRVRIVDINHDGKPDIVVASAYGNAAAFLGDGSGNFDNGSSFLLGSAFNDIAFGDMNNDGYLDAVHATINGVVVDLLNSSGAVIERYSALGIPSPFYGIALGDVNSDGRLDIAAANPNYSAVYIFLGRGDNSISVDTVVSTGSSSLPQTVVLGDINGDGNLDIVTPNSGNNRIGIKLGDGTGHFSDGTSPSMFMPQNIALGDVNNDGILDIAAIDSYSYNVFIYRGVPSPELQSVSPAANAINVATTASIKLSFSTAIDTTSLISAIRIEGSQRGIYSTNAITYNSTDNTITLTPSQTFKPGEVITVELINTAQSAAGAYVTRATIWSFTVQAGVGSKAYVYSTSAFTPYLCTSGFLADFNNDNNLDVLVSCLGASGRIMLFTGDGTGRIAPEKFVMGGVTPAAVSIGDVTNDGQIDVVMGGGTQYLGFGFLVTAPDPAYSYTWLLRHTEDGIIATALGDINSDGKQDVVGVSIMSNRILSFPGDGTGNYGDSTEVGLGNQPHSIVMKDVNNDGHLDLLITNTGSNSVAVYLGDGAGHFSNIADVSVGQEPKFLVAGDFNGDRILDIAVSNSAANTVSVRLGNGDGTFSGSTDIAVDAEPHSIALGDIDGDGDLDLVVGNRGSSVLSLLVGDGAGSFSNDNSFDVGRGSSSNSAVALGDVNGDGILDLAVGYWSSSQMVAVYLALPIPKIVSVSPSANAANIAPADSINLSFSTVMDAASLTSATIKLHGSLSGTISTSALVYSTSPSVLTLNPAVNFKPGETISVSATTGARSLLGVHTTRATVWSFNAAVQGGVGEFGSCKIATLGSATSTASVAAGDLDGDGDIDIFEGNVGLASRVWLNNGAGEFSTGWMQNSAAPYGALSVALADVDGDGDLDAFEGAAGANNKVWLNNGAAQFTLGWQDSHPGTKTVSASFGDIDGDGDFDVLEGNSAGGSRLLLNDGTGQFAAGWTRNSTTSTIEIHAATGDFDSDGDLDIFEVNNEGANKLWVNDGWGNFAAGWMQSTSSVMSALAVVAGDLDGDADLDIVEGGTSRPIRIWLNNSFGNFTPVVLPGSSVSTHSIALADADGDGDADIFAGNPSDTNTLYRNNGAGSFTAVWKQNVSTGTVAVAAADFDGDGDIDIFTGNSNNKPGRVWLNERTPYTIASAQPVPSTSGQAVEFTVEIRRENGAAYTMPADTTIGVIIKHPSLSIGAQSTQAVIRAGTSSTTLSISVINNTAVSASTTVSIAVVKSSITATSAAITIGSNIPPTISTTHTLIAIYESSSTALTVTIGDIETASTRLTVRAVSDNNTLLPNSRITQVGSTKSSTSFVVAPVANVYGVAAVTLTVGDGLYEVSTTITLVVRHIAPPTNLVAFAMNSGAQVQWTASTTAAVTAYRIYHSMSSGSLTLLATVPSTMLSYSHTGLTDGLRHYYAVQAVTPDSGYSAMGSEVSIIPNTLQVLYPNGGEVLQVGTEQILRWQYSGDISSMRIDYSVNNGATWTPITQLVTLAGNKPLTAFSQEWAVVDELTTTALIRVVSLSPAGLEEWSDANFSITAVSSPSSLAAVAGSTSIALSWLPSSSANISGYKIFRGTSPGALSEFATVGITTSIVDASVQTCTNYYYAVRAVANARLSPNSNTTTAQIIVSDNLAVASPNGGEIWQAGVVRTIMWTSTGCTISPTAAIEYSTNNGVSWIAVATTANSGSYSWLVPNTPTVSALLRVSSGALSDNSNAVFSIAPISAPTNLIATAGDGNVELHWTASTAAGISSYEIYRGTTSGSLSLLATVASTVAAYNDSSVSNCTLFVYAVRAVVGGMYSSFSSEAQAVPQITPSVSVVSPNGGEIWQAGVVRTIVWTSTGCTISPTAAIEYSTNNGVSWIAVATTANSGSYSWLVPNTPTVSALLRVSSGALSDNSNAVFSIAPISAPTNLIATAGDGNVELHWTASTAAGISSYEIYRGTTSGSLSLLATVASTAATYGDSSVSNCTLFVYAVRAVVGGMYSSFSSEAQAVPQITPSVSVVSPNGGEAWHGGQTKMITWTSTGCTLSTTVHLSYSIDNGNTWNTIATVPNTGVYEWSVPDVYSVQASVRVDNGVSDRSNSVFTLLPLPAPTIEAVQPIVTVSYCPGGATPVVVSVALADPIYSVGDLQVSIASSNQSVVATSSIAQQGATGATTSFVFTPSATVNDTAVLTITASNNYASASTTITVSAVVRSLPNTVINGSTSACAFASHVYRVLALPGSIYKWTASGGSIIAGAGTSEITVRWGAAGIGTVGVTVTGVNGCQAANSINVAIHEIPTPSIVVGGPTTVCAGGSVLLTALPAGMAYQWSNGATTQSITARTSGVYTVTMTNEYGCSVASTGVSFTVLPEVFAEAGPNISICSGGSVVLAGSGSSALGSLTFSWHPAAGLSSTTIAKPIASPSATTVYTLTVTDQYGCTSTASVTVAVFPMPTITVSSSATLCAGSGTQLQATGGASYAWTPTAGLDNPLIPNPVASPTTTTTYSVAITTVDGCTVHRSVTITVAPAPAVHVDGKAEVCLGSSVQLHATGGVSYRWEPAVGLDNPNIANPIASPLATTTYTATATNAAGCSSTATVVVTVKPAQISVSVLLEGPYTSSGMSTGLQQQGLIPTQQPYNNAPYNYTGTEVLGVTSGTAVVDWVLVELRSTTAPTIAVERHAALLTPSGRIVGSDGLPIAIQNAVPGGRYYVVVQHRNHLGVMSATTAAVNSECELAYSFTNSQSAAYSLFDAGAKELASGVFGMVSGDVEADGIINAIDRVAVRNMSGALGYLLSDLSLDGIVGAFDRVIVRGNGFRAAQVP